MPGELVANRVGLFGSPLTARIKSKPKYTSTWSLISGSLSNSLFAVVFADVVLLGSWLGICVEVDKNRITIFSSLPPCNHMFFFSLLTIWLTTVFNSFEKGSKMFFLSRFTVCSSFLPFHVTFEQLRTFARKYLTLIFF